MKKQLLAVLICASIALKADTGEKDADVPKNRKTLTLVEQLVKSYNNISDDDVDMLRRMMGDAFARFVSACTYVHEHEQRRSDLDPNFTPWS